MSAALTGYERADGRWGFRNHVLVLPLHLGANRAAAEIARRVPGAVNVRHDWEARPGDPDTDRVHRTFVGFASNPNVAAVLLVGLDDGDRSLADAVAATGMPVDFLSLEEAGGTRGAVERGAVTATVLVRDASSAVRQPAPVSAITLGLECGGSDALSGITANPALGVASDLLVAAGGTSMLAEVSELLGAEHLLAARAVTPEIGRRLIAVITAFEDDVGRIGVDLRGSQPVPGNIAGGLTTIEEKSLGAARKGGKAPISGVLDYGQRPSGPGLHVMDTPGHDIEQMVGMVAGGATVIAFTTGRGTPTGSPVAPCLKIATNTPMARALADLIDVDAGPVAAGVPLDEVGAEIFDAVLAAAAGELTAAERRGHREFALSRLRPGGEPAPGAAVVA